MCGIVGAIGRHDQYFKGVDALISTIRRRGPDDCGAWRCPVSGATLAHVRLSILDTSQSGHQPMISRDGRIVMVFNGEIYNFKEIRRKLESAGEVFSGHSDSEVLLALFAREGERCFAQLNGIFAAAFWDRNSESLWLVRDSLGVKPLYLVEGAASIVFASELKALLRAGATKCQLNPSAVLAHLGYLWSPGRETIVQGIRKLLPGFVLEYRHGKIVREWCYRDMSYRIDTELVDPHLAAQRVAAAVQQAVRRQMVSDVPLGAFLSGGLDSSAVVAFAQRELGTASRLQCFSIDIKDDSTAAEGFADDLPYARKVADYLGVDLNVVGVGREMMDRLQEMIYFLDEPTADPAALNTLFISELARSNGIKVLLSGAGGDDIFTGYRRHFALCQERWWAWLPAGLREMLSIGSTYIPAGGHFGRRVKKAFHYAGMDADRRLASYFLWLEPERALGLLSPDFRQELTVDSMFLPLLTTLSNLPADAVNLNRMLYLDCKHFLADHNLNYTDKMGMAAGVEIRVPLLDGDLVALANSLPVALKQRGNVGKWIFKRAMEPYLPYDVIHRPKTGFGVPLRRWLRGPLRSMVDDLLSPASLLSRGIFDASAVRRLLQEDRAGAIDASYSIFGIICLELWCRQYVDGAYAVDPILGSISIAATA